jgi:hypothetical protein
VHAGLLLCSRWFMNEESGGVCLGESQIIFWNNLPENENMKI